VPKWHPSDTEMGYVYLDLRGHFWAGKEKGKGKRGRGG